MKIPSRIVCACLLGSTVVACAARPKSEAAAPAAQSPAQDSYATGGAQAGYGQPQQPGAPAPAPPPAPPSGEASAQPATPSRAFALQKASSDIEAAQRELDVAGSSCQNACRALGSMDRAAGHLCQLTREETTHDRCDDAKRRLYGARDRVRNTCGSCPDNQPAVDRNAPVPSVR